MRRPALILFVYVGLLAGCGIAAAADPINSVPSEPGRLPSAEKPPIRSPGEATRRFEETQLPLYYLKDKDGNLQPVPGFSFEDFLKAYKYQRELEQPDRKPPYSIQGLWLSGAAGANVADLTIRVKVTVDGTGWVRVPLRFDQGVLRDTVRHEGSGDGFVHFEESGDGYVAWLRSRSAEPHTLNMRMAVPISGTGGSTKLRLLVPRATFSELKLKVPVAEATATVSEGATLLPPSTAEKGVTEFSVAGLGGEFELAWRPSGAAAAEGPAELEVVGALLARMDGRDVESEATLTARSYGDAFDRFHVQLPRSAELVAGSTSDYAISPIAPGKTAGERLVEIRLAKRTVGPVTVRLATRRKRDTAAPDDLTELGGFEVVEAARQWGHVAVAVLGDSQVVWGPQRGVRRTDQWPDTLRFDDVVAVFEYFSQPYSLTARLTPRKTRISVEPEFSLRVDADQVQLEGRLKYSIRGAKAFSLEVNLMDWDFDRIGPELLVDQDGVTVNSAKVLSIPLLKPASGELELTLRAHRTIPPGAKKLVLPLPQPQANALEPVTVAVQPADNVELTPGDPAMTGLTRQQVGSSLPLLDRQQEPLYYVGETGRAVFASGLRIHPQAVSVDAASQLSIEGKAVQVEQRFTYTIAYRPLEHLVIEVPQSVAKQESFSVQLEGQALKPVADPEAASPLPGADRVRLWLPLPKAYLGACELVLRYSGPPLALVADQSTTVRVPLAMPAAAQLTGNTLSVRAAAGISVRSGKGVWTPAAEERPRSASPRSLLLNASTPADSIAVEVQMENKEVARSTLVQRAWVQTWLTLPAARQDLALFRFVSNEKQVEVRVPEGAVVPPMSIFLDGKPVVPQEGAGNGLLIPLPEDETQREHLLELRYHFPDKQRHRGQLHMELPRMGRDVWVQRFYWQLVTPHSDHIAVGPSGIAQECRWGWQGFGWGRQPTLDQTQLEHWIGAAAQTPLPDGTNQYLFSSVGGIDAYDIYLASSAWIVLVASGAALVLGLLLIHFRFVRHPAILCLAAAAIACAGMLYPEPVLLAAQAAGLGLILAIAAGLLQYAMTRRHATSAVSEGGKPKVDKESTLVYQSAAAQGDSSASVSPGAGPATLDWDV